MTGVDDVRARLRRQADRDFPAAWIPEQAGDEVAGTIAAIRASVPTKHGPVPVVELVELGTERPVAVWLTHTVLRREFARQAPMPGEAVLIRYLGRKQPDSGGPAYDNYKLIVDRAEAAVDWNAIAAEHEPDLADPTMTPSSPDAGIPF